MPSNTPRPRRVDQRHAAPRRSQPPVTRRSPIQGRYAPPSADRLMRIKESRTAGGPSKAARMLVFGAVVILAGAIALAVTGGLSSAVAEFGHSLGGLVGGIVGGSPTPVSSTIISPEGAPRLDEPVDPWTNVALWDVKGLLPSGAAGSPTLLLVVYVGDTKVEQIPVPPTADFLVPAVPLQPGWNAISVAILDVSGEGPRSAAINVNFDDQPPALKITSPKDGSKASSAKINVVGVTQAGSTVAIRNALNGAAANTQAADDGSFKVAIDVASGSNALTVTATDPAGNQTDVVVTVKRGGGSLTAKLALSTVRINQTSLPTTITITLTVTDVGGGAVSNARVDFIITPPGQPASTFQTVTVSGTATWQFTIP
ncbi:MAG: Ig-like domain-containing protein, partial [Candidatus Limnocylindrales bacterium]